MGSPSEKAIEAAADAFASLSRSGREHDPQYRGMVQARMEMALPAACDPSLGPDRLVPAGEFRAEVVAENAEALRAYARKVGSGGVYRASNMRRAAEVLENRERERADG